MAKGVNVMGKIFKFSEILTWILLSVPVILVAFIFVGMGIVVMHEKF